MQKIILILIIALNTLNFQLINAQSEDYQWIIGYNLSSATIDTSFGNTSFDFNHDPVRIHNDTIHRINMAGGNASIGDKNGSLLAYSNGQVIMNAENGFIEDTINYSTDLEYPWCNEWDGNTEIDSHGIITTGLLGQQRVIILPIDNKYFVIYTSLDECQSKMYKVAYSEFLIDSLHPSGTIITKDIPVVYDHIASSVHAIRHGNGKDWWVIVFSTGYDYMYSFLLTNSGFIEKNKFETGYEKRIGSIGQICFSPDGTKLAFFVGYNFTATGFGFGLVDFNRCDGTITNIRSKKLPGDVSLFGLGVVFSGDSRYLYVANGDHIRQYDTWAIDLINSEYIIAETDGFGFYYPPIQLNYTVNFHELKLGPDGRIYVFPVTAMQRYISVIEYPYETHDKVNVKQHSIFTKIFTRTMPNIPEFRTGPLDGSPCDTLGLDNDPVAKFRYEADTLDHLLIKFTDLSYFRPESWRWDFGDGSPVVKVRYPTHKFPKNGIYKVCLLVNNENSANTVCRNINISSTATDDPSEKNAIDISLYPNPVEDMLQITLGEYIPEKGQIKIMDISGREIQSQRIYYGQNIIDMSQIASGMYLCVFTDGKRIFRVDKVVKE